MTDVYGMPTGDMVRVVKVVAETPGNPGSFPLGPKKVYKCLPCVITFDETEGSTCSIVTVTNEDRAIYAGNFRNNYIVENAFYVVFLIGNKYVLDNQAAFLEAQ